MERYVKKGKWYVVSARTDTTVIQEEVNFNTTVPANTQQNVYALCDKFIIDGDCIVRPFPEATR